MKASGNSPPMTVPAKAAYMPTDLEMLSRYWGLKIKLNEVRLDTPVLRNETLFRNLPPK